MREGRGEPKRKREGYKLTVVLETALPLVEHTATFFHGRGKAPLSGGKRVQFSQVFFVLHLLRRQTRTLSSRLPRLLHHI